MIAACFFFQKIVSNWANFKLYEKKRMEIQPPYRVNPIDTSHGRSFDRSDDGFPSKKLKKILRNLRESILNLSEWIEKLSIAGEVNVEEKMLLEFLRNVNDFYEGTKDLESYIDHPDSQEDLHFALEINAEIDDMLKGDIKKYTLCSYWKFDDFSFPLIMERAATTPLIDLKRAIIHLFNEISKQNWAFVSSSFNKMAKRLLV